MTNHIEAPVIKFFSIWGIWGVASVIETIQLATEIFRLLGFIAGFIYSCFLIWEFSRKKGWVGKLPPPAPGDTIL